jgi:hypothetical protein
MSKIILPDKVFGKQIKGAKERLFAKLETEKPKPQPAPSSSNNSGIILNPDMQKRVLRAWERHRNKSQDFIALYDAQGNPINGMYGNQAVVSCFELPDMNNMNYEDTHKKLLNETEFYMPDPFIFMNFFKQVVEAKQNKKKLYHPDGSPVKQELIDEMYKHLTTNYKGVYNQNNPGAWTWLNAFFPEVNIDAQGTVKGKIERVTGINSSGLIKDSRDLEKCLISDGFASLDFNSQGLSTTKSPQSEHAAGKNIYFYFPRKNRVARFLAYSDRAYLSCDRNPDDSDSALGVFGCAEGADARK